MSRSLKTPARFVSHFSKTVILSRARCVSGVGTRHDSDGGGCRVVGTWCRGTGVPGTGCRVWWYRVLGVPGPCTGCTLVPVLAVPWSLYWPGLAVVLHGLGCGTAWPGCGTAWPGLWCPSGLTIPGILGPTNHPRDPITHPLAAIVPSPCWRLPQPQKPCSKRLSILRLLRSFDDLNRPSRPKVLCIYTTMAEILSSQGEESCHIGFNPNC